MERVRRVATERKCFHWPLEFPEVFLDGVGRPAPDGGFDAVIGNPPWEMLRVDHGPGAVAAVRFSRESGIYRAQSRGHANQYQLFVERALSLLRPGGRLGLLVPGGFLTDHGAAEIRTDLLHSVTASSRCWSSTIARRSFPIHRGSEVRSDDRNRMAPASPLSAGSGSTRPRPRASRLESGRDFPIALTPEALRAILGTAAGNSRSSHDP